MRVVRHAVLPLAALTAAILIAACGGSDAPVFPPPTQPTATAAGEASQSAAPPAAQVEPTATPEPEWILDFDAITPVAPAEPLSAANQTLGGAADWDAEAEIAAALAGAGLQADVYVLPMTGLDEWLLIIEVDDEAVAPLLQDPDLSDSVSRAIADSPVLQDGRITQLAVDWHSSDETGPFILTITMSSQALLGHVQGTMTDEEVQAQTFYQIVRPDPQ